MTEEPTPVADQTQAAMDTQAAAPVAPDTETAPPPHEGSIESAGGVDDDLAAEVAAAANVPITEETTAYTDAPNGGDEGGEVPS